MNKTASSRVCVDRDERQTGGYKDQLVGAAERALRSSVVIRKITYGNQSDEGAHAHAVLMSVKGTCNLRKENFFDYAMGYLGEPTSER